MRIRHHLFMLAVSALLVVGCEQSFSPKSEFREQYVLQCFVQGADFGVLTPVTAVIARTYDVDGFDPSVNTDDPSIAGAEVSLMMDQKTYYLSGTLRASSDTSRYHTRQWVYSATVPAPRFEVAFTVTAKLPNGRILTGKATVPRGRNVVSSYDFTSGVTAHFNHDPDKPNWTVSWENRDITDAHLFVPSLSISYTKLVGNDELKGAVTVPMKYVNSGGGLIPVFPVMNTATSCAFEFPALDSAMAQISGSDPNKAIYGAHIATLAIIEYDTPLTKYFSSINGSLDQYSIRTDESVYSNVNGGIGIVGSYVLYRVNFFLDERYVADFGYRYR
jgi:hypothetical protein